MNISEHLKKDYWVRRVTLDRAEIMPSLTSANYKRPVLADAGHAYLYLTQENLMDEVTPTAHKIFSKYLSQRAVYAPTGRKNEEGKEEWAIDHYDDVEQVALAMQWRMAMSKTSHFASDGFWTADESGKADEYNKFKSWLDYAGMQNAWIELVWSCFSTGDAAIYTYQRGNDIEYKVFSRWGGYILYPDIDDKGNDVCWVEYTLKGKRAVDYYGVDYIDTWVYYDDKSEEDKKWLDKVKGLLKNWVNGDVVSEDGWKRISHKPTQVGNDLCQLTYFRVNDIPSGIVEPLIQSLEKACSYVAEEVKSSAFPQLFIKSTTITQLPPMDANGKVLAVKGDVETLKASDAKFLESPDASNIATLHLTTLRDEIYHASQSVIIDPEVLKSGADSSATMKILFTPEIQWCQVMWVQFYQPLRRMVEVFKRLVGKVEGNPLSFADLRVSVGQKIWIPQNRAEEVDTALKMVYAHCLSREAFAQEIGLSYINDTEQIMKEWGEEIRMKAEIPAQVKKEYEVDTASASDDDNPYSPNIDNNASGKSMSQGS